jgi:hypothetical protein
MNWVHPDPKLHNWIVDYKVLLELQMIAQFTDTGLELCFNMEGSRGTRELLKNLA